MTIYAARQWARLELRPLSDNSGIDAERLLLFVLHQTESSWLIQHDQAILSPDQSDLFVDLVKKRGTGYPLAYILGSWFFYGREFLVTPDVLIPRPDTEHLIEKALAAISDRHAQHGRNLIIADIGTGSGCIAVTLALESPFIQHIYATDISQSALAVARINAEKHGVSEKITFLHGTMLEPVKSLPVDLIVSNPPYVPSSELNAPPGTATIGLRYEPCQALDGGPDGQKHIDTIKQSGLPAVMEVTGGKIATYNF